MVSFIIALILLIIFLSVLLGSKIEEAVRGEPDMTNIIFSVIFIVIMVVILFAFIAAYKEEALTDFQNGKIKSEEVVNLRIKDGEVVRVDTTYRFYKVKK